MTDELKKQAIYKGMFSDNPFLDAMPDMLAPKGFFQRISSLPPLPHDLGKFASEKRLQFLPNLASVFVPMDYMYSLYDLLYRAMITTYSTRTTLDSITQINGLRADRGIQSYATQADSGSILGVPGIGKTSTIRRCLGTLPQVLEHTEYKGHPCYCQQVLYLFVECPSDCAVKTLAYNVLAALDRAVGSNYLDNITSLRSSSASAVATQVKILCITHHVGLILVDEIQNAVVTAQHNRQTKPLIRFLVELTNDTSTSVYFVGTPLAEELFNSQEHLKRRTRGIRLLPLKPDGAYRSFLEKLWVYQFTVETAPLTEKIANKLYDWSGGIPAYILKIFQESQAQALLVGAGCITEQIMQRAIDVLAIKVPKTFAGGTYLSDFELDISVEPTQNSATELPRLYANKRGRKAAQRDEADLLVALRAGENILSHLSKQGLIDRGDSPC